jgi:PPE-repeat protein
VDFWAPPEITSALIHSGPGPGSLLTAANVWRQLAVELGQTAADYASTVARISWQGPSAKAMILSTVPYVAWLHATAAQAAQLSMAATTMAGSFVAAQTAVVHPSVVTANRTQLAHLIATNFFGINFPAIAATEAQYIQMWAGNTTAMLGYHATSLQTMTLQPFTPPPTTSNPVGMAAQGAAVATAQAAADPPGLQLPLDSIFSNPTIAFLILQESSVIQSGFPFNLTSTFLGGHDFVPGQYPDVLAATPRNLAIAYNVTGPEAVGGAPNVAAIAPAAETSAVQTSVTASLGPGLPT